MFKWLARQSYYYFLNGYSDYTQVSIAHKDKGRTTFACPFGTYAFKKMSFSLCNALASFQRCMISITFYLVGHSMKIFVDDFSVFGSSFDD